MLFSTFRKNIAFYNVYEVIDIRYKTLDSGIHSGFVAPLIYVSVNISLLTKRITALRGLLS